MLYNVITLSFYNILLRIILIVSNGTIIQIIFMELMKIPNSDQTKYNLIQIDFCLRRTESSLFVIYTIQW